jgi:hypothetical protein
MPAQKIDKIEVENKNIGSNIEEEPIKPKKVGRPAYKTEEERLEAKRRSGRQSAKKFYEKNAIQLRQEKLDRYYENKVGEPKKVGRPLKY